MLFEHTGQARVFSENMFHRFSVIAPNRATYARIPQQCRCCLICRITPFHPGAEQCRRQLCGNIPPIHVPFVWSTRVGQKERSSSVGFMAGKCLSRSLREHGDPEPSCLVVASLGRVC